MGKSALPLSFAADPTSDASFDSGEWGAGLFEVQNTIGTFPLASGADLSIGSTTFGTDQTAALQALLDRALTGPLHLIINGKHSCTGLVVHSNTRITILPGCGLIQRAGSDMPLLRNANRSVTSRTDRNIIIDGVGGILNHNGRNQAHDTVEEGYIVALSFIGIENLMIREVSIYDPATFSVHLGNWRHVEIDRHIINVGYNAPLNTDGLHINGNGQFLTVRGQVSNCNDDQISISPDDGWAEPTGNYGPFKPNGPISDITIDGLTVQKGAAYGIRILSGFHRIERVSIRNVRGITRSTGVLIDNFFGQESYVLKAGLGNVGSISIDDVDLTILSGLYQKAIIFASCKIDQLSVKNVRRRNFVADIPTVLVESTADIKELVIDCYSALALSGSNVDDQIVIKGNVDTLRLVNSSFLNGAGGTPIHITSTGRVGRLIEDGNTASGFSAFVNNEGKIDRRPGTINFVESLWYKDTLVTEDTAVPTSLTFDSSLTDGDYVAFRAQDDFAGNVIVATRLNLGANKNGTRVLSLFARASGSLSAWTSATGYALNYVTGADVASENRGFYLTRFNAGTETPLSSRVDDTAMAAATDYDLSLYAKTVSGNVNLSAYIKRVSDGYYLNSSGTFVSTRTAYASLTDSASGKILVAGRHGIRLYKTTASDADTGLTNYSVAPNTPWTFETGVKIDASDDGYVLFPDEIPEGGTTAELAADAYSGDVLASANLNFGRIIDGYRYIALFARGASVTPWASGTPTAYALVIEKAAYGTYGVFLTRLNSGTESRLTSALGTAIGFFTPEEQYLCRLMTKTVTGNVHITGEIQRVSDGYWLTSAGAWQASAAKFADITDSSGSKITGAGKSGVFVYGVASNSSETEFTNFAITTAP